jgi:3-hydroxymyristoyl/3-hydroxydecanoyl-(acyl carrier protein) dehydratase
MEQLRRRIDAVFLPRPLLLVDRLPRNATGKLPQQALASLVEKYAKAPADPAHANLCIAADHPAYEGHFPGFPLLPGAALLDEALHEIELHRGIDLAQWQVASAKFSGAVRPGDPLTLEHSAAGDSSIRFAIRSPKGAVASGTLTAVDCRSEGLRGA